jgi:glycosyltransferase involved in cell wall biosynthesis
MKIAILTGTLSSFSGIDRVVERQARELVRENQVTVFCLAGDLKAEGYRLEILGMPKNILWQRIYRLLFFLDFSKVNKVLRQLKDFDLIYSHQYPMNYLAWQAKKKFAVKYVYYNHGLPPSWTFSSWVEKMYIWKFRILTNWTARKADEVISVSQYLANCLKKETGRKSDVVYNQVDEKRFNPSVDGSSVRQKFGLKDGPLVLYVGRLSPHKGVDLLIESFKIVRQRIPAAKLLIVGKPTFARYFEELKRMADQSVLFAGYVADAELPQYYAAADLYATATLWEGYDLPLAEAQAVGKKVVCFDLGPHPEIVKNGILVPPKNIEKLAAAIIKFIRS